MPAADASQWHPTHTAHTQVPFRFRLCKVYFCCFFPLLLQAKKKPENTRTKLPVHFRSNSLLLPCPTVFGKMPHRFFRTSSRIIKTQCQHRTDRLPKEEMVADATCSIIIRPNIDISAQLRIGSSATETSARRASLIDSLQFFACSLSVSFTVATSLTRATAATKKNKLRTFTGKDRRNIIAH